jgi:hypothetical protein
MLHQAVMMQAISLFLSSQQADSRRFIGLEPLISCYKTQLYLTRKTALILAVRGLERFFYGVRSPRHHQGFSQLAHP